MNDPHLQKLFCFLQDCSDSMSVNVQNDKLMNDKISPKSTLLELNHHLANRPKDHDERKLNDRKILSSRRVRLFSIQTFVAFAGLVMCAQTALSIYSKSVLTSIEKRFGISSSMAGFIVGSFNIGNLIFVVAVSKFSSTGHRPRIMAIGSFIIALGGFVNFIPHFVNEPYQPIRNSSTLLDQDDTFHKLPSTYPYLFVVLIFGEILQGIGATVQIPLSSSYIDDFASKDNSPLYLGILFVLQNIGPGFGYLIGSWTSTLYVDFDRIPSEEILVSSDDKDLWIGAWWLGYVIISGWVILTALPLFFFPKSMPKVRQSPCASEKQISPTKEPVSLRSSKTTGSNRRIKENFIRFCKDFWQTVKRLMTNLVYMSVVFGYSGLMFVVGSLTAFMPKFLEIAFNKSSGSANLTFGLAVPPTICLGLLVGGIVVKKFKWEKLGILRFIIFSGVIALIPLFLTFFVKCELENEKCNYTANGSISNTSSSTVDPVLLSQACRERECHSTSIFFVSLTAVSATLASNMVTPIYTVILRSVDAADKCTAIGLMFLIIRVLGLVPAPIVTGAVIDNTCVLWNEENGERRNCLQYNEVDFRLHYLLINFVGILFTIFFITIAYIKIRSVDWRKDGVPPRKLFSTLIACLRNKPRDDPFVEEETNQELA